ncbi:MAG: hypothetical protein U0746_20205 [Gemmataceae bacterium]
MNGRLAERFPFIRMLRRWVSRHAVGIVVPARGDGDPRHLAVASLTLFVCVAAAARAR